MQMREVTGGVAIPAGGSVTLKPGSYHVMLMGLKKPLVVGQSIPLTLTFAKAGNISVTVPVQAMGATAGNGGMSGMSGMQQDKSGGVSTRAPFALANSDAEVADPAGAAVDQDGLAGLQLAVPEQALPRRLPRERNGRGMDVIRRTPGFRAIAFWSTTTFSAYPPPSMPTMPKTSSPTLKAVACAPHFSTMPETSRPACTAAGPLDRGVLAAADLEFTVSSPPPSRRPTPAKHPGATGSTSSACRTPRPPKRWSDPAKRIGLPHEWALTFGIASVRNQLAMLPFSQRWFRGGQNGGIRTAEAHHPARDERHQARRARSAVPAARADLAGQEPPAGDRDRLGGSRRLRTTAAKTGRNQPPLHRTEKKEAEGKTAQQEREGKFHVGASGKRESSRSMGGKDSRKPTAHGDRRQRVVAPTERTATTWDELYGQAQRRHIEGQSKITKRQLEEHALGVH